MKRLIGITVVGLLVLVVVAIGISARFSFSNITADTYAFIEKFFTQWSPALGAASTIILVVTIFWTIYDRHRSEEKAKEQVIHALHDEIHSNLTDIIRLRFQVSEKSRQEDKTGIINTRDNPFQFIDAAVFDSMKNGGQLHWLREMRMHIIFCYKLIKQYNQDAVFKPYHLELLEKINAELTKAIRDLEANFKFLPHYLRERHESTS